VFLPGNLRNINIFLCPSCPKDYRRPADGPRRPILEYHRKNIIPKPDNICVYSNSKPGHIFQGCGVCSCSLLSKKCRSYLSSTIISFRSAENIFNGTRNQDSSFRVCDLCPFGLLAETNNVGLIYVLLPSVPTGTRHRDSFSGLWPLFL
jgi:hypothetical protein